LAICLGFSQLPVLRVAQSQDAKRTEKAVESKPLDQLQALSSAFEKAFNAGDAKSISAQFAENAEIVDEDGNVLQGRAKIEERFSSLFKEFPRARIEIEVSLLRQLGPDVAVEDGFSVTTLRPDEPPSRSPYTLIYLKRDGNWLAASVRDFPEESTAMPHDHLQQLEWLVGHWVDESQEGRVETTCEWSEDGNYLLQNYVLKTRRGAVMKGVQRIGWDGLRRTIRSWAFDHSGAFAEATWTVVAGGWVLKVEGVTPDGHGVSVTRTLTPITRDSYQLDATSLVVGNELLPDTSVRVVRRPSAPTN
jgi:uncharacterized protein (TIGR02246 family)